MTRALVTGGAGFIGSNLCKALLERGYEVTVLDNNYADRKELLEKWGVKVVHGYVRAMPSWKNVDVVFHLAAICLGECIDTPYHGWHVNTEGTLAVCKRALETKTFMVYVSSSEAYGNNVMRKGVYEPLNEEERLQPTTLYGASKAAGELITRTFFCNKAPLEYLILRPFNTYGPYAREDKYAMVITKFIQRLKKGLPPEIHGDGFQTRDWTYIDDTVRGIIECYEQREKLALSPVVNICSGTETMIHSLFNLIVKTTNCYCHPIHKEQRLGDVRRMFGDTFRAKHLVGFQPTISLEEGLRRYVSWWDENH